METDLIKHFFPIELLDHFEYRSSQIKMGEHGEYLEVEFEEKNELLYSPRNSKTMKRIIFDFWGNENKSIQ